MRTITSRPTKALSRTGTSRAISPSRTSRAITRARQIWDELDYAQRRVFEYRTGIPAVSRRDRRIARRIDELESLYARDHHL